MARAENSVVWPVNGFTIVGVALATVSYACTAQLLGWPDIMGDRNVAIWSRSLEAIFIWTCVWGALNMARPLTGQFRISRMLVIGMVIPPPVIGGIFSTVGVMIKHAELSCGVPRPIGMWRLIVGSPGLHPLMGGLVSGATLLFASVFVGRMAPKRGVCRNCSYDLTGNISGICSECGTPVSNDDRSDQGGEPGERKGAKGA